MPAPAVVLPTTAPSRDMPSDVYVPTANAWAASLPDFGTSLEAIGEYVDAKAGELDQIIGGAGFYGTSTTPLTIGTGAKSLTTQAGLSFRSGAFAMAVDAANLTNKMWGPITYDPDTGAMVITVAADGYEGSGSISSWYITLTGDQGPAVALASAAEILAGNGAKAMTAGAARTAAAKQTLTDASTIAWNLASGTNAKVTLGANRIMGLPTNIWEGCSGRLEIVQDGTGSRLITAWNAFFDFGFDGLPVLSTGAGKIDVIYFDVYDASGSPRARCAFSKAA